MMDPEYSFKHVSTILNFIPGQTYVYEYATWIHYSKVLNAQ